MNIPAIISERLLQFVWQFQYISSKELTTIEGEPLQILHPGFFNTNEGPDFLQAKIKIGNTVWAGNIELHIRSSEWYLHGHEKDPNYSNIILHVVWQQDKAVLNPNGHPLPALELQPLVANSMLFQYEQLMQSQGFVACENLLPVLSDMHWLSWKERLMAERLQRKSITVLKLLKQANHHWEEVFWWLLARNFGMKVNAEIFEQVARSIPINLLAKHKYQIHQLEALLIGQAGLLNDVFEEDYPQLLQREYNFIQRKYNLTRCSFSPAFLRMRPANFPALRLAQLAMLVNTSSHLFSKIKEIRDMKELRSLMDVTANDYWHYHYRFDDLLEYTPKKIGRQMVDNIIINTIVPVLFSYGAYTNEIRYKDQALQWLSELPPEQNHITKAWKIRKVGNTNAMDSQALIELKNNYCSQRRCLDCAVGNKILGRGV